MEWETIQSVDGPGKIESVYSYPTYYYRVFVIPGSITKSGREWNVEMECSCQPHVFRQSVVQIPPGQSAVTIGCSLCSKPVFRVSFNKGVHLMQRAV